MILLFIFIFFCFIVVAFIFWAHITQNSTERKLLKQKVHDKKQMQNEADTCLIKPDAYIEVNRRIQIDLNYEHQIACFLRWIDDGKRYSENPREYPGYFYYNYGIDDMRKFFQQMINENFIEHGDPRVHLMQKKVVDLKDILKRNGLPVSGVKAELVNRILANIPNAADNEPKTYVVSKKGKVFVANSDYYKFLSVQKYDISWEEYQYARDKVKHVTSYPRDIAWEVFQLKCLENFQNGDFGLLRNNYFNRYQLLFDEGKKTSALVYLLCVFYLDLSGWGNGHLRSSIEDTANSIQRESIPEIIKSLKDVFTENSIQQAYRHVGQIPSYFTPVQFRFLVFICLTKGWVDKEDIQNALYKMTDTQP